MIELIYNHICDYCGICFEKQKFVLESGMVVPKPSPGFYMGRCACTNCSKELYKLDVKLRKKLRKK